MVKKEGGIEATAKEAHKKGSKQDLQALIDTKLVEPSGAGEPDISANAGPLGPFEQLMEGERFKGYKNKN